MKWLEERLTAAKAAGRRVIVAGHNPLLAESSRSNGAARTFDHEEVAALLDRYADVAPLYLAGHYHGGGCARRPSGVHHVTIEGMVETGGHAVLSIGEEEIAIEASLGSPGVTSRTLPLALSDNS